MKRLLLTFALIFAFVCAQAADITSISNAFKAGNASSLSGAMDKVVDVALPSSSKKCNGSEAVSMLSSFFSSNKPSGFSVVHHADKKESGFLVGKLPTSSGEYRVNITYRAEGNTAIIQSIRISVCRGYWRWRSYHLMLHPRDSDGEKPADHQGRWRIGRRGNG